MRTTHSTLARSFDALATGIEAGLPLTSLLDPEGLGSALVPELSAPVYAAIRAGASLEVAVSGVAALEPHERGLIAAGERSGRLAWAFATLAADRRTRDAGRRAWVSRMVYPSVLVCVTTTVLPLPVWYTTGLAAYLAAAFWGPALVATAWLVFARWLPALPGTDPRRAAISGALDALPWLGTGRRRHRNARFARVLGASIEAGMTIRPALEAAASSTGSAALIRTTARAVAAIEGGSGLSAALRQIAGLDRVLLGAIQHGEASGTLDRALRAYADGEEQGAQQATEIVSRGLFGMIAVGVMVFISYRVVVGFRSALAQLDAAIEDATR